MKLELLQIKLKTFGYLKMEQGKQMNAHKLALSCYLTLMNVSMSEKNPAIKYELNFNQISRFDGTFHRMLQDGVEIYSYLLNESKFMAGCENISTH